MNTAARVGGAAAIVQAICYLFGFVVLITLMNPDGVEAFSQSQRLEYVLEHQTLFQWWNIVIYVLFGAALVVLTTVLHQLLQNPSSLLVTLATPFGFIWAGLVIASGMLASVGLSQVASVYAQHPADGLLMWSIISTIQDGIGGGVEVVGGLWVLLLSVACMRTGVLLPKLVNWVGLAVGVSGVVTVVPGLSDLGAIFGLLQIPWFIGVGIVLMRLPPLGPDRDDPEAAV